MTTGTLFTDLHSLLLFCLTQLQIY